MKSLLSLFLILALCSSCLAADDLTIDAKDAAQHVGEAVVVHGTVAEVHTFKGGSIALDFGAKYPNDVFEVYIPVNLASVVGDMNQYENKEMVVEGTIILYKGKPEIKLEDAGQLRR
jgi:hypothetical protein